MKKVLFFVFIFSFILISLAFLFIKSKKIVNKDNKQITVRLKWLHQSQFAGMYVADKKKFYEEEGLNVGLIPFDYEHLPIKEVVSGKADFGISGADELLIARSNGQKVKAIAVIYQKNPVCAYALKESGIITPKDFINKKVGMEKGINVEFIIRAMLSSQNIDYDQEIKEIPIGYDYKPLANREVDIATGYAINEPIQAEEAGYRVNIIYPSDYGVNLYADVIFTTEKMIKDNPELVRKFLKATLRGWRYAIKNVNEAVNYTLSYYDPNNNALNFAHQKSILEKSIPLIKPEVKTKIGEMNDLRWRESYELLKKYGLLNSYFNFKDAYTNEFIK